VRSRDSPENPGPLVARIHPETVATRLDGDLDAEDVRVHIESRRGAATARVDADEGIPEGVVWLPIHHPATNDLTVPAVDPQSAEPNLKQCAVRVVPADPVDTAAAAPARDNGSPSAGSDEDEPATADD